MRCERDPDEDIGLGDLVALDTRGDLRLARLRKGELPVPRLALPLDFDLAFDVPAHALGFHVHVPDPDAEREDLEHLRSCARLDVDEDVLGAEPEHLLPVLELFARERRH